MLADGGSDAVQHGERPGGMGRRPAFLPLAPRRHGLTGRQHPNGRRPGPEVEAMPVQAPQVHGQLEELGDVGALDRDRRAGGPGGSQFLDLPMPVGQVATDQRISRLLNVRALENR